MRYAFTAGSHPSCGEGIQHHRRPWVSQYPAQGDLLTKHCLASKYESKFPCKFAEATVLHALLRFVAEQTQDKGWLQFGSATRSNSSFLGVLTTTVLLVLASRYTVLQCLYMVLECYCTAVTSYNCKLVTVHMMYCFLVRRM